MHHADRVPVTIAHRCPFISVGLAANLGQLGGFDPLVHSLEAGLPATSRGPLEVVIADYEYGDPGRVPTLRVPHASVA